jgi:hypothetical protein
MPHTHFGPELNNGLNIFVFGSNLAGRHGLGAAAEARHHWGAIWGKGVGLVGQSYALPTKDIALVSLRLPEIFEHVKVLKSVAKLLTEKNFLVTKVGCGLAGYREADISPMFLDSPPNMFLPDGWRPANYSGRQRRLA